MSWTVVRPTAYFKDFTDVPWRRMRVGGLLFLGLYASLAASRLGLCGGLRLAACCPGALPSCTDSVLHVHVPSCLPPSTSPSHPSLPAANPRPQAHDWMLLPGGGAARYNPIDGAELAAFMADCLLEGGCANEEVRCAGGLGVRRGL